jgi:hypothetical protein
VQLTPTDFNDLSFFFARRFPDAPLPESTTEASRWLLALEHAQAQGTLSSLLEDLADKKPADENLQDVCDALTQKEQKRQTRQSMAMPLAFAAGAMASGIASAAVASLVLLGMAGSTLGEDPQHSIETVAAMAAPADEELLSTKDHEPLAAKTDRTSAKRSPVIPREPVVPELDSCWKGDGELVGYWYSGMSKPGRLGAVLTVQNPIKVRADYPGRHNKYNGGTTVQCVMQQGDRVHLNGEPVQVHGGTWWVPLMSGDVEQRTASLQGGADKAPGTRLSP